MIRAIKGHPEFVVVLNQNELESIIAALDTMILQYRDLTKWKHVVAEWERIAIKLREARTH